MPARLHVPELELAVGELALPERAAHHLKVLRLDTDAAITLFNGRGGEWQATVLQTRRDSVRVQVHRHVKVERELSQAVHLAIVMPANDRMDALIEKATELGAASFQPLVAARSVLRLDGARAAKKVAHWQAIAVSACEQCGRNRVPTVHGVQSLNTWLQGLSAPSDRSLQRVILSAPSSSPSSSDAPEVAAARDGLSRSTEQASWLVLSGPEGGFTPDEAMQAGHAGFEALSLGPRVLRADTAPLAWLSLVR